MKQDAYGKPFKQKMKAFKNIIDDNVKFQGAMKQENKVLKEERNKWQEESDSYRKESESVHDKFREDYEHFDRTVRELTL